MGANVGDWSIMGAETFPTAHIHSFEIVPDTANTLRNRVRRYPQITVTSVGLSDQESRQTVYAPEHSSGRSSLYRGALAMELDEAVSEVVAETTTGDTYMRANEIAHIDYLKIDVEGAELSVLSGFSGALASGCIDMIQFEYNAVSLVTRHFLADFYGLLEGHGFRLGKLYPEGVLFKPYDTEDEDFLGSVYFATRRADVAEAVAAITALATQPQYGERQHDS